MFDAITFAVLLKLFDADAARFQTGWFVESILTQILVIFVDKGWVRIDHDDGSARLGTPRDRKRGSFADRSRHTDGQVTFG